MKFQAERDVLADAKLAAITAYCQKRADAFNATMPLFVRPEDMRVAARSILAIVRAADEQAIQAVLDETDD
jgi:hypothetical protein